MAYPVLLDTDMGVDDAVALTLALCAEEVELAGVTTVAGNVSAEQAARNAGRCLGVLRPAKPPRVACGLEQSEPGMAGAAHVFGRDGLGEVDLPLPEDWRYENGLDLYEQAARCYGGRFVVVAIGPLTNLAAVLRKDPSPLARAERIVIMGGAVFCPGNVTPKAEFNVWRDPAAAAAVFASGLPITLVPLDVTQKVALDESHIAHLLASNTRSGQMLARMMEYPLRQEGIVPAGRVLVHDALAIGVLLWPELFLQTQMSLKVATEGPERGRTSPVIGKSRSEKVSVILSVQVADFVERALELLCHEKFVV